MNKETKKFLRDLERVSALGEIFAPKRRRQNPAGVLTEIRPGVFVSVDEPTEAPPSPFRKLRETLEGFDRADKLAKDVGREIRRRVP